MRFCKIFLLGVFLYTSIANAQDVMVDLSVLDNLDTPNQNVSKPIFPVLPKKTDTKINKVATQKQKKIIKPVKKHKPKKNIEKVKPLDDDIVVVDFEPVSNTVAVKKELPKSVKMEVQPLEKNPTEETKPAKEEKVIEKSVSAVNPVVKEEKNKLLVADKKRTSDNTSYIVFANDVYELNDEQKAKIDSIVAKYKNTPQNKIAIYSYNFDNGVDSFKKKRTSLNRAVEIRSYLLKKGYKNFSIKVINISNESDKNNMVKLQEI